MQGAELLSALTPSVALSLKAGAVTGSRTLTDVICSSGSAAIVNSVAPCGDGSSVVAGSGSPSAVGSGMRAAQRGDGGLGTGSGVALVALLPWMLIMLNITPIYIIFIKIYTCFLIYLLLSSASNVHFRIEPEVVGHLRSFQLLNAVNTTLFTYCFFTYYIACSFGCSQKPLLMFNFVACALEGHICWLRASSKIISEK